MSLSNLLPLLPCFLLSGLFVGGLYVWDSKYDRNHPSTIKKRFCSVFVVVLISPFIFQLFIRVPKFQNVSTIELIGFRSEGLLPAAFLPLFLTMVLFLGPLCMVDYKALKDSVLDSQFWVSNFTNLVWVRNTIVGPLAEEFTFRACMVPLLLQCFEPFTAAFVCSLFFGLAHIHLVIESYRNGEPCNIIAIRTAIQFSYTTLFGGYSAYIFLKTRHFVAPFIVHAFCNIMGFPDFGRIFLYDNPKRNIIIVLFVAGVIFWWFLINSVLDHRLYSNDLFFNNEMVVP